MGRQFVHGLCTGCFLGFQGKGSYQWLVAWIVESCNDMPAAIMTGSSHHTGFFVMVWSINAKSHE